ncbi:preprotein translocase subunit SecG [Flavobacterium psychrophilum]|uniref:preprotein translocase subunit SecG n=1 Tax=Flavobacterium psychrophilum TaxID=96345 RepID=UPI002A4571B1|nr:preprotein translocase subunit SecG [Flavobacterium psychrophilum]EKT4517618.1 preprotein translocase subunit SecG [Flavobacterium psychrophilum]
MSTFTIFLVLITIVCFLLIVVIMVQNPKGGGLSSSISGSTQMGGVQKTTDFLDKSTWYLGAILIVLILMSSLSFNGNNSDTGSKVIDESALAAPAIPTAPQVTPAATKTTETPATKPVTEGTKK